MYRLPLLAFIAAAAWAQAPADLFNKPPAEVDEALRARMTQFYDYHVKKEFRKAEELVADDTKEFFYSHNKPAYLSFEIKDIKYSDNFTKAKAMVLCEQYVMIIGFADKAMKIPTPSTWKLENGKWYWFVDPESLRDSPFGKMTPGTTPASSSLPSSIPSSADFVLNQVKTDKTSVSMKAGETAEVAIANAAPGMMMLSTELQPPGVTVQFSKPGLGAGERGVISLKAGPMARSGAVNIRIQPTGELIVLQVAVAAAELPAGPAAGTTPAAITSQVKTDRNAVVLKRGQSAKVAITNGSAAVKLTAESKTKGVTAVLSKASLKAGEKSVLTIRASAAAKSATVNLLVQPGGETIPIQVEVK